MLITTLQNTAKKIITNKIFKTTIVLIMLLYILFSSVCSSFAVSVADMSDVSVPLTVERAGNYVANFAINFESNFGKKATYSTISNEIGRTYDGYDTDGKYYFSSTSWIAFVYNQCLRLQSNDNFSSMAMDSYVSPHTQSTNATWDESFFEQIKFNGDAYAKVEDEATGEKKKAEFLNIATLATNDEIQPGDILVKTKYQAPKAGEAAEEYTGEVFLYIGAGQVLYCKAPETEDDKTALIKCYLDDLDCTIDTVLRIKETVAEKILDTDATLIFAGKSYDPGITYQGIPGYGTYLGTTTFGDFFRWLVDCLANILDYLVGIITYAVRAVLIGWTNLVENLVHDTLLGSSEDVNGAYVNSLTGKANNLDKRVSIEEILFNKIPILDVNFFGVEEAGGSEIAEDSIVYMLRNNIANWYYIIRLISIVVMLFILIYVGIRIAITTTGQRKAQYKSAITGWVVGFIAVIAIHLFMYIVFEINEYLVALFEKTALAMNGGEFSLYETIRTKSYAPKFTEGFGSTIIYMFLVYTLIKFSIIYFKRYLTVTILGLIGPIMGLKYAVERATGRKTKSLGNWMFEFSMNVLLQAVHALLYVCLMQIAITMAFTSLSGFVVALVILNFMLKADKIFMKIFSFDRSKSVGDTVQQEGLVQQFAKFTLGAHVTIGAVKGVGKGVGGIGKGVVRFVENSGDIWYEREAGDTKKKYQRNLYKVGGSIGRGLNKITGDKISSIAALSLLQGTKDSKKMDKAAINALKLNMKLTQKTYKRTLKAAKASIGGATKMAMAIPLTVADPMAGIGMAYSAYSGIKNNTDRTAIENNKIQEEYEDYLEHQDDSKAKKAARKVGKAAMHAATGPARLSATLASFGAGGVGASAHFDINSYEDARMKNHRLIENLKKADVTEKEIDKLYKELEDEISRTNAGLTADELKEKVNKEFSSTAKEALTKRVKSSTVKGAVDEYMSTNSLTQLSELDIDHIMDIIKRRESEAGKTLEFDSDVLDNVRTALQEKVDANVAKRRGTTILASDMQGALKKGLSKQGSIKSNKVDSSKNDRTEEIKAKLQEKVREYENLYEGSGKKVEKAGAVLNRAKGEDKSNN